MLISGNELAGLMKREFVPAGRLVRSRAYHVDTFQIETLSQHDPVLSITHLKANFDSPVRVADLHDVDHLSLHFQLKGHSMAHIRGIDGEQPISAGQMHMMACFDPIGQFQFPRQGDYEYISVCLTPAFAIQLLNESGLEAVAERAHRQEPMTVNARPLVFNAEQRRLVQQLMHNPFPDDIRVAYQRTQLMELMLWFRFQNGQPQPTLKRIAATDEEKLRALKTYLDEAFLEDIALPALTKQFLLNEFKLRTGFRALYHTTPYQYLLTRRMQYACERLREAPNCLPQLASQLHYSSVSHFSTAFKAVTGYTPSAYARVGRA